MRDCDLINEFGEFLRYGKRRAERTVASYKSDIEQFIVFLASDVPTGSGVSVDLSQEIKPTAGANEMSLSQDVNTDKVRDFMSFLYNKGYSQASRRRKLATLTCFYNFLYTQKFLDFNPTVGVEIQNVKRHKPKILTHEQIWTLLSLPDLNDPFGIRDKAILEILCYTGIRVSELITLNIDDVDFDKHLLQIISRSRKTRSIELKTDAIESVRDYLNLRQKQYSFLEKEQNNKALFINKFGKRLDIRSADRRIQKYIALAGFQTSVTPYDLRHSFALKLLRQEIGIEQFSDLLGFESLSAAKLYADLIKSEGLELQKAFLE